MNTTEYYTLRLGALVAVRDIQYRRRVLKNSGITITTVQLLVMMREILSRKRMIGITIKQLLTLSAYANTDYDVKRTFELFNRLVKRGMVTKLPSDCGVLWSMTRTGKRFVREYCDWLGGAHDGEIGLNVTFVEDMKLDALVFGAVA